MVSSRMAIPFPGIPPPTFPPRPRAVRGFVVSLAAGIMTIIAGIAGTAVAILFPGDVPVWLAPYVLGGIVLGFVLGILIFLGAFLIWHRYLALGGIMVFFCSLANVYLIVVYFITTIWSYVVLALGLLALIFGIIGAALGIAGK
ncbi:hypothetical protein KEJ51_01455 [Candidatus Bathyarchaeota archaeon]|nr:hypothetical protein [Candidatus Bathyarchaeota archaeon]MBS7629286.1 hypothetical protein [Candidatus Bathyarchaeota archaeon]